MKLNRFFKRLFISSLLLLSLILSIPLNIYSSTDVLNNNDVNTLNSSIIFSTQAIPLRPSQYKYVNDYTNLLSIDEINKIVSIGAELEAKTGAQASVVIVNSTEGIPIEQYAISVFRDFGIGQNNKNNGLLILLSLGDKKWRVEVGSGLEGAIPDALSNQIMNEIAKPEFATNNVGSGLVKAYSSFSDYIAKEYSVKLDKSLNINLHQASQNNSSRGMGFLGIIFAIVFLLDILFNRGRFISTLFQVFIFNSLFYGRGGRGGRGPRGGGGFGGFGGGSSNGGGSSGGW